MANCPPYGLLLEEMDGYKKRESYRNGRPSVSFQKEKVLKKGTLLIALSHEEFKNIASHLHHVHNYKPVTDLSVSLCCETHQVFQITREQRDKIHAVKKLEDRLKAVHKLDWIDGLHFGSYVYVTIPASTVPVRGVVRHIGKLQGESGTMFGVELMVCACVYTKCSVCAPYTCLLPLQVIKYRQKCLPNMLMCMYILMTL